MAYPTKITKVGRFMVFKYCLKLDLSLRRGKGILFSFQSTYVGIILPSGRWSQRVCPSAEAPPSGKDSHFSPVPPVLSIQPARFPGPLYTGHWPPRRAVDIDDLLGMTEVSVLRSNPTVSPQTKKYPAPVYKLLDSHQNHIFHNFSFLRSISLSLTHYLLVVII